MDKRKEYIEVTFLPFLNVIVPHRDTKEVSDVLLLLNLPVCRDKEWVGNPSVNQIGETQKHFSLL